MLLIPITYRLLTESDSIDELTDLLHRAYADHAAAGRKFFATHQTPQDTLRRIARGQCWLAICDEVMIGTITFTHTFKPPEGYPPVNNAGIFNQFGVDPIHRGKGIGNALLSLAERKIAELGADEIVFDTASNASDLIAWYQRHGYVPCGTFQWNVTNYQSIVMKKLIQRNDK